MDAAYPDPLFYQLPCERSQVSIAIACLIIKADLVKTKSPFTSLYKEWQRLRYRVSSARQGRLFLPAFNQVPPSVTATTRPPESTLMKPSIPEGAVLTVSPPRRPSLGKLPRAPSLRAAPARSGCALPARTPAERRRRPAARRPATPALRVRPRLGGPWPPSPAA